LDMQMQYQFVAENLSKQHQDQRGRRVSLISIVEIVMVHNFLTRFHSLFVELRLFRHAIIIVE